MKKKTIFSRIELFFWNCAIKTLSRPGISRAFSSRGASLVNRSEMTTLGILMGITGVAGLFSGYLFFFLASAVR